MRILAVCLAAILSSGCAANPGRMSFDDLNHYQIDCSHKYEQIAFLQSQMPTSNERMISGLTMNPVSELIARYKGETTENRHLMNREYDAVIRVSLHQLEMCPDARPIEYPATVDCSNKYAQIRWLEGKLTHDRQHDAPIKREMWDLESSCKDVQ